MSEVQESLLEQAAPKAIQNQGLDSRLADESLPKDNPIVNLVTSTDGGSAVFDKEKLKQFLRTHAENYLPIGEDGEIVGIIPMGLMREVFLEQEAGRFSNPLLDSPNYQSQSFPNV
jgi:hypothetical protein